MDFLASGTLDLELLKAFGIAVFLGALIGVEREHHTDAHEMQFGGLRTFILIALFGALTGWLSVDQGLGSLFVVGALGLMGVLGITVYLEGKQTRKTPGLTTEMAAVVTYLLGGAVLMGYSEIAVVLAITTSAVLTFKKGLHGAVRAMGRDDIVAILKLLSATFIVLPLLPNHTLDPWGALNPYKLWWLVVLISSLSLIGYIAVRLLGNRRGMALTGLFGGLVSSTAVTLTFARRSKEPGDVSDALAVGILLAWAVMFARVLIEVAVVNAALLAALIPSMLAMFAGSAALLAVFYRRGKDSVGQQPPAESARAESDSQDDDVQLKNPFSLTSAIQFGLFFAAVLLVVKLAQQNVPDEWLYLVATLAGATDVDAITLSMAELARGGEEGVSDTVAVLSILLAAWSNTAVKCGMVISLGSLPLKRRIALSTGVIAVAGAAAFGIQVFFFGV